MKIIEQKPNLKIKEFKSASNIKDTKPNSRISARTSGVLNDWTYDQIDVIYNQTEFTYDGITFYDIAIPHSSIKSLTPHLRIK